VSFEELLERGALSATRRCQEVLIAVRHAIHPYRGAASYTRKAEGARQEEPGLAAPAPPFKTPSLAHAPPDAARQPWPAPTPAAVAFRPTVRD